LNHLVVDFDLNHFGAYFYLIYKSFFSWVIYDFDLNKKKLSDQLQHWPRYTATRVVNL